MVRRGGRREMTVKMWRLRRPQQRHGEICGLGATSEHDASWRAIGAFSRELMNMQGSSAPQALVWGRRRGFQAFRNGFESLREAPWRDLPAEC